MTRNQARLNGVLLCMLAIILLSQYEVSAYWDFLVGVAAGIVMTILCALVLDGLNE